MEPLCWAGSGPIVYFGACTNRTEMSFRVEYDALVQVGPLERFCGSVPVVWGLEYPVAPWRTPEVIT